MPYANNQRRRDAMTRERADAVNAYARKWRKDNYHKVKNERQFYIWLKRHGYPQDDFKCLCWNCNCSRGRYGYCPHEREQAVAA